MTFFKRLAAGAVGAAVAGGGWYLLANSYGGGFEWLACLVGLATGSGVRLATEESERGLKPGILAVAIAMAAVLAVKHEVVIATTELEPETAEILDAASEGSLDEESMIARTADEIALEREAAGEPVEWPEGMTFEMASFEDNYPPELWSQARTRWEGFSVEEQSRRRAAHEADVLEIIAEMKRDVGKRRFKESFSALEIVWFLIAASAAFRLAAGRISEL